MGRPKDWSQVVRMLCVSAVAVVALPGCASMESTPIQQYVWEMGHNCEHVNSSWQIDRVDAKGRYWISGGNATSSRDFEQCMREQYQKHPYKQWLAASATPPRKEPDRNAPPRRDASRADVPVWKPGDEWQYRWQSPRGNGTFVWAVNREEIVDGVMYYVVAAGTTREIYYRKTDFAYSMEKVNGEIEVRHTPPSVRFPWPPWPGEKIEARYTRERPVARQSQQLTTLCESGPAEMVGVPAGSFEAVKITCRDGGTGAVTTETWVAVAVKNFVRQRTYFSYGVRERELIAFQLH
jgi:hypothetical protein